MLHPIINFSVRLARPASISNHYLRVWQGVINIETKVHERVEISSTTVTFLAEIWCTIRQSR